MLATQTVQVGLKPTDEVRQICQTNQFKQWFLSHAGCAFTSVRWASKGGNTYELVDKESRFLVAVGRQGQYQGPTSPIGKHRAGVTIYRFHDAVEKTTGKARAEKH